MEGVDCEVARGRRGVERLEPAEQGEPRQRGDTPGGKPRQPALQGQAGMHIHLFSLTPIPTWYS